MTRRLAHMLLFDLNLFLGLTAVAGGIALLVGWINVPVGGTALLAAWLVHLRMSFGIPASAIAGGTIIIFEIVEWNVIGFAWLQAAYIVIGAAILGLATWVRMADVLLHVPEYVPPRAAR